MSWRTLVPFLVAALAVGCTLTPEGDPLRPRSFSAEADVAPTGSASGQGPWLRLGRVRAAEHLGFRLAWRDGPVHGHYERRRWNESPVVYLERALVRRLFHADGLRRSLTVKHPTLEVTLLAFEEARRPLAEGADAPPPPRAVATLGYVLLHGERLLAEGTVTSEVPAWSEDQAEAVEDEGDPAPRLVAALGRALREAVDRLAGEVGPRLPAGE